MSARLVLDLNKATLADLEVFVQAARKLGVDRHCPLGSDGTLTLALPEGRVRRTVVPPVERAQPVPAGPRVRRRGKG